MPKLPLLPPKLCHYYPGVNPFEQMKRSLAVGLVLVVSGCAAGSQSRAVTTFDPWAAQSEILCRIVPSGKYLTGPIHLRNGVNLHVAEGAEIIFSDKFEDYLPVVLVRVGVIELYNYSPLIYARDCTNIAVTGKGKLNGNAKC